MTFHKVPYIPETEYRKTRNDISSALEEFMKMNIKFAQVEYSKLEFECSCTANSSIRWAIRNMNLPIKLYIRNSTVYLERTDIE